MARMIQKETSYAMPGPGLELKKKLEMRMATRVWTMTWTRSPVPHRLATMVCIIYHYPYPIEAPPQVHPQAGRPPIRKPPVICSRLLHSMKHQITSLFRFYEMSRSSTPPRLRFIISKVGIQPTRRNFLAWATGNPRMIAD